MMSLKTKQEQAEAARVLSSSFELVQHGTTTYIPAHWDSELSTPLPALSDRIWLPLTKLDKRALGNQMSGILFANESEANNFDFQLRQLSRRAEDVPPRLFMRTEDGLRVLTEMGELIESDGTFLPNYIRPRLNTDDLTKKQVFEVIANWVDSDDEAHSLLSHLATCLSPGWSAAKYVLLIGEGRNGKSLLMLMLSDLFGKENTSFISRQHMSEKSPVCVELNGKLLNVVYDGMSEYLRDSSTEKSLVVGEQVSIRLLYESVPTPVQTNALFIEGLNKEPKSKDKGSALQKRLVRFKFPHVFELDLKFERYMRSEPMLGAFLSLLLDHFVLESDRTTRLALSLNAAQLQLAQMRTNSAVLQFLEHALQVDPSLAGNLQGAKLTPLLESFMAWRLNEGYDSFSSSDAESLFEEYFVIDRKTIRVNGKFPKVKFIKAVKPSTLEFMAGLVGEGGDDEASAELVVD